MEEVKKHIEVVAAIIERKGKILCMQRAAGKYDYVSYKWEFAGGKIEEVETYEQALIRELREEMEMNVDIDGHYMDVTHEYPDFTITMHVYKCKTKKKNFKMNVHNDFKWLSVDKLKSLDWAPADMPIVKKLILEKKRKKKTLLYKFVKIFVRMFVRKSEFFGVENLPNEPALIIGNHSQLHGPFACELFFPTYKYIWCRGEMMHIRQVPKYAMENFFFDKPKGTKWFYKIISCLIAPLIGYIMSRSDTIAVYRDSRLINTFRDTIKTLDDGAHIVIYPECDDHYNEIVNDFNRKFVDVAKMYYNKTKIELQFVPMYIAVELKKVVFGKPIKYDHTITIEEQREIICNYIKNQITKLAKELPAHRVVPFLMTDKKNYPMSK